MDALRELHRRIVSADAIPTPNTLGTTPRPSAGASDDLGITFRRRLRDTDDDAGVSTLFDEEYPPAKPEHIMVCFASDRAQL